jgi:hypothetical protein
MNAAAAKAKPFIISRRALQGLKHKYPQHLKEKSSKSSSKTDDSAWPKTMQRAGYTAVALAIPYSICIIIAESPRLRASLEGDPGSGTGDGLTRKMVNFIRWYWGKEDHIPYAEYVDNDRVAGEGHTEVSLDSDISTVERVAQERIQEQLRDELKVKAETDGDGEERYGKIDGRVGASDVGKIWNTIGMGADQSAGMLPTQLYLTFEDDERAESERGTNSENGSFGSDFKMGMELDAGNLSQNTAPSQQIANLTSIWSAWYHFAEGMVGNANANTNASSTGSSNVGPAAADPYYNSIEELKLMLQDVERDLNDPYCIKDRDDMETEIKRLRAELGALKKERRMHKLKKFVKLSS